MNISTFKQINYRIFILYCIFILIISYQSFHYLLQFGDINTSPTYADTPELFKYLKFLLLTLCLSFFYIKFKFFKRINKFAIFYILTIFTVLIFNLIIYENLNMNELKYVYLAILLIPLFLIDIRALQLFHYKKGAIFNFISYYLILSNLYVVVNFIFFDRLTAQAYPGSMMVRFAGFWDMPNAFAAFNVFMFYYNIQEKRYIIAFLLLINVVLTFSLSGYIVLIFALAIISLKNAKYLLIITTSVFLIVSIITIKYLDFLLYFYENKKASISDHLAYFNNIELLPILSGEITFNESFIVSFFTNYFPISIISLFSLLYISVKYIRTIYGIYLILFIIGNMFIPQIYAFPNNFFFFFFIIILIRYNEIIAGVNSVDCH